MTQESGLEFFTDEELFNELAKRHTALIVAGTKSREETLEEFCLQWEGGCYAAIGVLEKSKTKILAFTETGC